MKIFLPIAVFLTLTCATFCVADERDDQITQAVRNMLLSDEVLTGTAIDVSTHEGVVTLGGKVIGHEEIGRAVHLAESVPGVVGVRSELKADVVLTNKDVKQRLEDRKETIEEQKELSETAQPVDNSVMEDAAITTAVKVKLAADEVGSLYRIDVDTNEGRVTLTGTVKTELDARRLIALAESVDGVRRVTSVLTLKPE